MLPVVAEMLSRRTYYQDHGIIPLDAPEDPLDVVTAYPQEDFIEGGPKRTWVRRYWRGQVYNRGCSLKEFFALPYHEAKFIIELADSAMTQESTALGSLVRGMKE